MIAILVMGWSLASAAESRVVEVTAFPSSARVVRQADLTVAAGRSEVLLEGLPTSIVWESLAAEGEGNAGAVLTGLSVRTVRGVVDLDARVAALQKERLDYADQIAKKEGEIANLQWEMALLTGVKPAAPATLDRPLFLAGDAPTQLAEISRMVGDDSLKLRQRQREIEVQIRDLRKEVERIDRSVAELLGSGGSDSLAVAVGLDAKVSGQVRLRLSYLTADVSWSPSYNARYDLKKNVVHLDLVGEVRQQTGEDWSDVALRLSTASPREEIAPPELSPYYLEDGVADAYTANGAVSGWEFSSKRPEDVASDGTVRRVFLEELTLPSEVVYEVVPRRDEAAWLTALVHYHQEYTLPSGPMHAYLGSAYVGSGTLDVAKPGEELAISFGVDDRVAVKRERLEDKREGTRPMGSKERRAFAARTTVKNHTGEAISVKVIDQVPATREAAWQVNTVATPPVKVPEDGVLTWEAKIENGAEQAFTLEYEVVWPESDPPVLME